jgi:hypothetical protein
VKKEAMLLLSDFVALRVDEERAVAEDEAEGVTERDEDARGTLPTAAESDGGGGGGGAGGGSCGEPVAKKLLMAVWVPVKRERELSGSKGAEVGSLASKRCASTSTKICGHKSCEDFKTRKRSVCLGAVRSRQRQRRGHRGREGRAGRTGRWSLMEELS